MTSKGYGKILTISLIILVALILAGIGIIVYNYGIKPNREKNKAMEAITEFDRSFFDDQEQDENNEEVNNEENSEEENNEEKLPTINPTQNNQGTNANTKPKKSYYNGFVMIGYITIPKTNVKQPIIDSVTPEALNTAVALLYPTNAKLNEPGNVVIVGHNYRNGQFFSNNKKLSIGDKIYKNSLKIKRKNYTA